MIVFCIRECMCLSVSISLGMCRCVCTGVGHVSLAHDQP